MRKGTGTEKARRGDTKKDAQDALFTQQTSFFSFSFIISHHFIFLFSGSFPFFSTFFAVAFLFLSTMECALLLLSLLFFLLRILMAMFLLIVVVVVVVYTHYVFIVQPYSYVIHSH